MPGKGVQASLCGCSGGWKRYAGSCSDCPSLITAVGEADRYHLTFESQLWRSKEAELGADGQLETKKRLLQAQQLERKGESGLWCSIRVQKD